MPVALQQLGSLAAEGDAEGTRRLILDLVKGSDAPDAQETAAAGA